MTSHEQWSDEAIKALKGLAKDGLSSGQISKRLKISRSAVCGKLSRLGISLRPAEDIRSTERKIKTLMKKRVRMPVRTGIPVSGIKELVKVPDEPPPVCAPREIAGQGACKWIHGDVLTSKWVYCGNKVVRLSSSFCAHHHHRAYQKVIARSAEYIRNRDRNWKSPI